MKLLSIIFSFRNEEENIEELVNRVSKSVEKFDNWRYELIFVNDDSIDESEEVIMGGHWETIKIEKNKG